MTYDLLRDPSSESVALVDSELGRALGPVLSGPDAERVMEAFVGALGIDPAKLEHWEIQFRFNQYLEALQGDVQPDHPAPTVTEPEPEQAVPTEPVAPAATTADPGESGAANGATPAPSVPTAAEGAPTDEPPPPAPADADPPTPDSGEATPPATSPDTTSDGGQPSAASSEPVRPTVPEGLVTCPECEGWGTVAENGAVVQCRLCLGEGSVEPAVASGYLEGRNA